MAPIEFADLKLVGYEEVDTQHRTWIDIFNKLEESVSTGGEKVENGFQARILKEILDFTRIHFTTEEKLMQDYDYPDAARHSRMHKDFGQEIYENYRLVMNGEEVVSLELLKMVHNWFMSHTNSEDLRAFQYINEEIRKREGR